MPYKNSEDCPDLKSAADKHFQLSDRLTQSQIEDANLVKEEALIDKKKAKGARDPELSAAIEMMLG